MKKLIFFVVISVCSIIPAEKKKRSVSQQERLEQRARTIERHNQRKEGAYLKGEDPVPRAIQVAFLQETCKKSKI